MADDKQGLTLGRYFDDTTHSTGERIVYAGERHMLLFGPNGTGRARAF